MSCQKEEEDEGFDVRHVMSFHVSCKSCRVPHLESPALQNSDVVLTNMPHFGPIIHGILLLCITCNIADEITYSLYHRIQHAILLYCYILHVVLNDTMNM